MRQCIGVIVMICFILAGCSPVMDMPVGNMEDERFDYTVINDEIIRKAGDEQQSIYNAAPYYDAEWTTWIGSLTVQDDALYFTESSVFSDGISCICETESLGAAYVVVRTDKNGENRQVLARSDVPSGFWDVAVFSGFVFYVQSVGGDALSIGYVGMDGSLGDVLELSPFAPKGAYLSNAVLDLEDRRLLINADFYDGEGLLSRVLSVDESFDIAVVE